MTLSGYLKCEVCGRITQVKIEISSDSMQFPIYVPCKNCDTLFVGMYRQNDDELEIKTNFVNAVEVKSPDNLPDYICTITREFVSDKIQDITCAEDTITFPKWMSFKNRLGIGNLQQVTSNMYLSCSTAERPIFEWSRILNLWFNENYELLKEQLDYHLDASLHDIKLDGPQNYLSGIRKITYSITNTLFSSNEYEDNLATTRYNLRNVMDNPNAILFIKKLGNMDLFIPLEKMITERVISFFTYVSELMPIFTIRELTEQERNCLNDVNSNLGIFTTSFDRIKPIYIDLFETSVKTLIVPIGLNNILQRGSYDNFSISGNMDLEKFQKIDKAFERMQYLEAGNPFSFGLEKHLNNKLRNSIGHCAYNVSNVNQVISYDKCRKEISLLNVLLDSYEMMMYLIKVFDIVTLLHEAYYKFK